MAKTECEGRITCDPQATGRNNYKAHGPGMTEQSRRYWRLGRQN